MGWDWSIAFLRYGERWRSHRRVLHKKFHSVAAAQYHPIQLDQTRFIHPFCSLCSNRYLMRPSVLLRRLYETPTDFVEHVRHMSGAIIMQACYWIHHLDRTFI